MTVVPLALRPAGLRARLRARGAVRAGGTTTSVLLIGVVTGVLLAVGLIMILSSSWVSAYERYGSPFLFFQRQLTWAAIGVAAMVTMARIDYRKLRGLSYLLLLVSLAGLVAVLVPGMGVTAGGSSRWLDFGLFRVQPSEMAKLALVLVAADLCVRKGKRLTTIKSVILPIGLIGGVVGLLVMMQPDLGTTLIAGGIVCTVLFVAGTPARVLGALGLFGGAAALGLSLSEGYRRARLFSFIDPFRDPLHTGYQAVQARIALGSGGLFGVGLGASRQKWRYVPNAHTDFIFAILGEETGLVGTFAVVALFGLLVYAGIRVACRAPDPFGRLVAAGITAWIGGQAVMNMGAVTGLLPITGVPLPLITFGGSALVITLMGMGILMSIARHETAPRARTSGRTRARADARARGR